MRGSKGLAALGGAGLEQERGTLGAGLAEVHTLALEVAALMADLAYSCRVGKQPPLAIPAHRLVAPASLPEIVDQMQVIVCQIVGLIMGQGTVVALTPATT